MHISLTEEQQHLREVLASFLKAKISLSLVSKWDRAAEYPSGLFNELRDLGITGACISEDYNGGGGGPVEMTIITEELARYGLDIGSGFGITAFLARNIEHFGTDEQRRRYLPRIVSGEERHSISITEPDAGSDAGAITTKARATDSGYVLSGNKVFTTGAGIPNTILHVSAVTEATDQRNHLGIFLVPATTPGITIRRLDTLARHILGTYEVEFRDVEIQRDQLLGSPHGGWQILVHGLEDERLISAALSVGAAATILDETTAYVKERRQFGQTIGSFQTVAHKVADMWTSVLAARLMTYNAASLMQTGKEASIEVSAAKVLASETLQAAADTGMQLLGGYGYMMEVDMQRLWREARSVTITAGTSEIQRSIIAKQLGLFESLRKQATGVAT